MLVRARVPHFMSPGLLWLPPAQGELGGGGGGGTPRPGGRPAPPRPIPPATPFRSRDRSRAACPATAVLPTRLPVPPIAREGSANGANGGASKREAAPADGGVLAVDPGQGASHFRDVTCDSMRPVYFSYASVSVENWMIFSWPWNGCLRQTSTCGPETSITL